MAAWCLKTGRAVSEWHDLTRMERAAFESLVDEYAQRIKNRRR